MDPIDELQTAEILRANELVELGQELGKQGKIQEAVHLIIDAVNIFLDNGIYLRVAETLTLIVSYIHHATEMFFVQDQIQEIIQTMEYLDLDEEIAKMKLTLANLAYQTEDYLAAGNMFVEIANLFFQVDPEEYRQASGMFLLRAGECFEKLLKTERAERLIFDAIQRFETSNFDYSSSVHDLIDQIQRRKYAQAVEIIKEIAKFFRKLENQLESAPEFDILFSNLKKNVKSRLFHIISEFNFVSMMLFKLIAEEEHIVTQAEIAVEDLREAIEITKEELQSGIYSKADIDRLCFDIFLLQTFQEFANYMKEDARDLAIRGLNNQIQAQIHENDYYESTVQLLDYDLAKNIEIFEDIPLPQILRPFRDLIMKAMKKL